jgi:hypothetical protein
MRREILISLRTVASSTGRRPHSNQLWCVSVVLLHPKDTSELPCASSEALLHSLSQLPSLSLPFTSFCHPPEATAQMVVLTSRAQSPADAIYASRQLTFDGRGKKSENRGKKTLTKQRSAEPFRMWQYRCKKPRRHHRKRQVLTDRVAQLVRAFDCYRRITSFLLSPARGW